MRRLEGDFDYIVVGAGTAGCILANRLSADPKNRVLILEAGGDDNWIWFHIPVGYLFAIGNPRSDWMFKTEPEPGLNGRALAYPRGKVIGGSSAINAMISMRGQAADYDHWRQLGLTGWGYDDVLPAFRRLEDHFLGDSEHHGAGGGWRIEAPRLSWAILDAVGDAAQEMGIQKTADFNTGDNEGVGYFHVNQKRGRRWSSARGFLKPVLNRANLRLEKNVLADRLIVENGRAVGVRFIQNGEAVEARAKGEVILMRRLDRIDPVAAPFRHRARRLAGAARHRCRARPPGRRTQPAGPSAAARDLQGGGRAHPQRDLLFAAAARADGPRLRVPPPRPADHGAVAARHFHALGSAPRPRQHPVPRAAAVARQVRRSPAPLSRDHGQRLQFAADLARHRADSFSQSRTKLPRSRQIISPPMKTAKSPPTPSAPRRRLMKQPALARYRPQEYLPGPTVGDDDASLAKAAGDIGTTIFHPVGTAKMGTASDPLAVVDERLRFHGIAGLRVVDASVMPTITSGNTNTPTAMIAEKGAAMILEDGRR